MVEITTKTFDFHYTQYASEGGSRLNIFDYRNETDVRQSKFYSKPNSVIDSGTYSIETQNSSGDHVKVEYDYDYSDAAKMVSVQMVENPNVNPADGYYKKTVNGTDTYIAIKDWPATDPTPNPPTTYSIETTYEYGGQSFSDPKDAMDAYVKNAIGNMLDSTTVSLETKDYTTMDIGGDEKTNVAIRAEFTSYIKNLTADNGIDIKHSGISGDKTTIPRFPMNTVVLGLYAAGSKTIAQAEKTLGYTKKALEYVSAKRSLYGAYQNRLEHTYNNNLNSSENTSAAESRIRDTDMATEMVSYSNNNIIRQAAMSMLSQANQQPNTILQLLQE